MCICDCERLFLNGNVRGNQLFQKHNVNVQHLLLISADGVRWCNVCSACSVLCHASDEYDTFGILAGGVVGWLAARQPGRSCSVSQDQQQMLEMNTQYFTVMYCTTLSCTILHSIVLHCSILFCTVLCCTVLYSAVLYCTLLYCTELYCSFELTLVVGLLGKVNLLNQRAVVQYAAAQPRTGLQVYYIFLSSRGFRRVLCCI